MRCLAFLSGGLDSIAAIKMALNKSFVTEMHMIHIQRQHEGSLSFVPELYCSLNFFRYCKKTYNIPISIEIPILHLTNSTDFQDVLFYEMFANFANHRLDTDYVIIGSTRDDDRRLEIERGEYGDEIKKGEIPQHMRMARSFTESFEEIYEYGKFKYWRPAIRKTKMECLEYIDSLPYWSCQKPVFKTDDLIEPCGRCHACEEFKMIKHRTLKMGECRETKSALLAFRLEEKIRKTYRSYSDNDRI